MESVEELGGRRRKIRGRRSRRRKILEEDREDEMGREERFFSLEEGGDG
jgi:hypothetical protein